MSNDPANECAAFSICLLPEQEAEDDEFYTANQTMVQQSYARQRRARGLVAVGEESTMVEHSSDGTITDLGTLVIIDDDPDEMDTMKSE